MYWLPQDLLPLFIKQTILLFGRFSHLTCIVAKKRLKEVWTIYEIEIIDTAIISQHLIGFEKGKDIILQINKQHGIFCPTANVYSNPLPFYATQTISPFLTSMISANHDKGLLFQSIVKSLYSRFFGNLTFCVYLWNS